MEGIGFSRRASKYANNLEKKIAERMFTRLQANPFRGAKRISGTKKTRYRIRLGSLRILFQVQNNELYVIRIDKRGRVYKR